MDDPAGLKNQRLPPDDPARTLAHASADGPFISHVAVGGNTYSILLTGEQTGGRYSLTDMHVMPGGGPPPHRHDFEEMFFMLAGEIEVTFRGETVTLRDGDAVNVPANAPHAFRNASGRPARMLCLCSPPGQERYFQEIGVPVPDRTSVPQDVDPMQELHLQRTAVERASFYRTELVEASNDVETSEGEQAICGHK